MVDITHKVSTLRMAKATAVVKVSDPKTIDAVRNKEVPKGDVFEMAKAAGLLGIKKTPDLLPDCHPIPVEYAAVSYEISGLEIIITVEVKTIYKTGVEVEAMHGASVVALTIYDMLKPIDKGVEIGTIKLEEKKGGKSDFNDTGRFNVSAAVVVCSSRIASGNKEDKAGPMVQKFLTDNQVSVDHYDIVPDNTDLISGKLKELLDNDPGLILFCGGTGVSVADVTPESITPLLDKEIPGIMEAARAYGQSRTPYAMLSRGVAGVINNTLILTIPGSVSGAIETLEALFPAVLHAFKSIPQKNKKQEA